MRVEIDTDLFGLAMMYLQKRQKDVTAEELFMACEQILQWSERRGRCSKSGSKKLEFRDSKIYLDDRYLKPKKKIDVSRTCAVIFGQRESVW